MSHDYCVMLAYFAGFATPYLTMAVYRWAKEETT